MASTFEFEVVYDSLNKCLVYDCYTSGAIGYEFWWANVGWVLVSHISFWGDHKYKKHGSHRDVRDVWRVFRV